MRNTGREEWKRLASIVLVAVIATLSLPVGASAVTRAVDATPAQHAQIKRLHVEARPVVSRRSVTQRSVTQREATVSPLAHLVAALALLGLLFAARPARSVPTPAVVPVPRGPPSYALNLPVLR